MNKKCSGKTIVLSSMTNRILIGYCNRQSRDTVKAIDCAFLDLRNMYECTSENQLWKGEFSVTNCAVFHFSLRYLQTFDCLG